MTSLKEIWDACFPGEEAFRDYFFEDLFRSEYVLTEDVNGKPVAMLCAFPRFLEVGFERFPIRYLYAVSTLPEYQGRGYASALIRRAAESARAESVAALAIILQSPQVVPFYERLGFRPVSLRREEQGDDRMGMRPAADSDIPQIAALYARRAGPKLYRSERDWQAVLRENDVWVGEQRYAVFGGGRVRENSENGPQYALSLSDSTAIGCLLDLTSGQRFSGVPSIYIHLAHN